MLACYNPTIAIIGKLVIVPAMPVDIPMREDRPKDIRIMTKAYHCGYTPYKTVANQPVQTCPRTVLLQSNRGIYRSGNSLVSFPAIAGFKEIHCTISRFIHPFNIGERFFVDPARNVNQLPCI